MYVIVDWTTEVLADNHTFETFEDGWDWIFQNIPDENYEDVFVVPADADGEPLQPIQWNTIKKR